MDNVCPLCGSSASKIIGKPEKNSLSAKFISCDYRIVQCSKCSLYYVSPPIEFTTSQWELLYKSEYFGGQSQWLEKKRKQELSQRFNTMVKYLTAKGSLNLLDIGTGEGKALIEGFSRGWEVTGIDIADNRIEEARKSPIHFLKGEFINLDLGKEAYDLIYLDSVLEHILTPLNYLQKIKSLLKPGGVLYIGVPNEDSLFNSVRRLTFDLAGKMEIAAQIKPFDHPYHVIGFNRNSLKEMISIMDFKLLYLRNFGRKFNFLSHNALNRGFIVDLFFLLPVEYLGNWMKRDVYYELYLSKP